MFYQYVLFFHIENFDETKFFFFNNMRGGDVILLLHIFTIYIYIIETMSCITFTKLLRLFIYIISYVILCQLVNKKLQLTKMLFSY